MIKQKSTKTGIHFSATQGNIDEESYENTQESHEGNENRLTFIFQKSPLFLVKYHH